jgi:putative nucleotidyltransferase with HDIG domain
MQEFFSLRPLARVYVSVVVLLGAATVAYSVRALYAEPIGSQWFILAGLTLLTGSFTVKVPSTNASLSVSETFVFASVLLFGPSAGAITVLLECLIILFWMKPSGRAVHRLFFNTAAPAIAIWTSGTAFFALSKIQPYSETTTPLEGLFLPLLVFTALYFLLNSWMVAVAIGLETKQSPLDIWWKNFTWLSVNYFSGASVAALLVTYTHRLDFSTLAVIVPLLVVSYLTFRTAMGRVEDAGQHLAALNRLYLSTIETLAMAIDAKDQVTHGHIRRVQTYATGLARELGVKDDRLLRAIEAAALLHDMGKLAVPEYILNKPGKLTAAEFDKMKLHASVGADILSAIDFPYPVVPIVRHHHENWNGTGYPTGLRGTDIPVGARILSVVDCFDALTSDRPYRPRLSDSEALQILIERRGSMYDPLVVDTFVRVHATISPERDATGPLPHLLDEIASARRASPQSINTPVLDEIAASGEEVTLMYELASGLSGSARQDDAAALIANHIRRLIPWSVCILYRFDEATSELEARHVFGSGATLMSGIRIPLGQRLSGWVAANRHTIVNSDPVLDLGDVARSPSLSLRSCISTPILLDDSLVGVLSLYSSESSRFADEHRRVIEAVARQIAQVLSRSNETASIDTGRPTLQSFDLLVQQMRDKASAHNSFALLFIRLTNCSGEHSGRTAAMSAEAIAPVGDSIRNSLGGRDTLFSYDANDFQFVVLANGSSRSEAHKLANDIRQRIGGQTFSTATNSGSFRTDVSVTVVCSPSDGTSVAALVELAKSQEASFDHGRTESRIH